MPARPMSATTFHSDVAIRAAASQGKGNTYARLQHHPGSRPSEGTSLLMRAGAKHTDPYISRRGENVNSPESIRDISSVVQDTTRTRFPDGEERSSTSLLSYKELIGNGSPQDQKMDSNGKGYDSASSASRSPSALAQPRRRSAQRERLEESLRGAQRYHHHLRSTNSTERSTNPKQRKKPLQTLSSLAGFSDDENEDDVTAATIDPTKGQKVVISDSDDEDHSTSDYFAGRSPAFRVAGNVSFSPSPASSPTMASNRYPQQGGAETILQPSIGINRSHSATSQSSLSPQPYQSFVSPSNSEAHRQRGRAFSQSRMDDEEMLLRQGANVSTKDRKRVADVVNNPATRPYRQGEDITESDEDDSLSASDIVSRSLMEKGEGESQENNRYEEEGGHSKRVALNDTFDGEARLKALREERMRLKAQLEEGRVVAATESSKKRTHVSKDATNGKAPQSSATATWKQPKPPKEHLMRMANLDDSNYYHQINAGHTSLSLLNTSGINNLLSPSSSASPRLASSSGLVSATQYPDRQREWQDALRSTKSQTGRIIESDSLRQRRLQDLAVFRQPVLEAKLAAIRNKQAFNKEAAKSRRAERFRLAERPIGADGNPIDKESLRLLIQNGKTSTDEESLNRSRQNDVRANLMKPDSEHPRQPGISATGDKGVSLHVSSKNLGLPPKGPSAAGPISDISTPPRVRTEADQKHLNSSRFTNSLLPSANKNASESAMNQKSNHNSLNHACTTYHGNIAASTTQFADLDNSLFAGGHGRGLCPQGIRERLQREIMSQPITQSFEVVQKSYFDEASVPFVAKPLHLIRGGQRGLASSPTAADLASGSLLEAAAAISSEMNSSRASEVDATSWWQIRKGPYKRKPLQPNLTTQSLEETSDKSAKKQLQGAPNPATSTLTIDRRGGAPLHQPTHLKSDQGKISLPSSSPLSPHLLHSPSTFAALQPPPTSLTHPHLHNAHQSTGTDPAVQLRLLDTNSPLFRKTSMRYAFELKGQPKSPSLSASALDTNFDKNGDKKAAISTAVPNKKAVSRNSSIASRGTTPTKEGRQLSGRRSTATSSPSRVSDTSRRSISSAGSSTRSDRLRVDHRSNVAKQRERQQVLMTKMSFAHQYGK